MADTPPISPEFKSKEEFRAACQAMSRRLHYLNRVAMGESKFVWEAAELLKQIGRAVETHTDDPEVKSAFGDGWSRGTLTTQERRLALFDLLNDQRRTR